MENKNAPLHLLIVEDSPDDAELLVQALRHGGYAVEYLRVDTATDMRAALENQTWDLVTSDHAMPRFSAPAALALAQSLCPELPVIIVSGEISQPLAIELLTAGAGDFIRKDNLAQLPHAVERELSEAEARHQRHLAETALHEAIQFHQEILSGIGEGILVLDRDLRYVVWNRFVEQLTGLPAEQMLGHRAFDVLPEMRTAEVEAVFQRVWAGETVTVADRPFILPRTRKEGWVSTTYSPHRNAAGQIIGIIVTLRDTTERNQAEAEIKRLKAFNEDIIQNVAEGIVIQDADGRFTFANPAACRLLDHSPEELIGLGTKEVVPPELWLRLEAADPRRTTGSSGRYEIEIVRKDGSRVPVLVSSQPRFEAGRWAGSLSVFTDIRERKQAEALVQAQAGQLQTQNEELQGQYEELYAQSEALRAAEAQWRASEEKYRTLVEQSEDGILLVDERGCVCEWNRAHAELTGLPREAVIGQPYWDILFRLTTPEHRTPERLESFKTAILEALRTGHSPLFGQTLDATLYTARGETRYIQQTAFLVHTLQGRRLGSVTRDATDRKRVEQALRDSESRLRAIIEQSSEAITLIDSRGCVQEWNRACEKLSGLPREQVIGQPYGDVQLQIALPEHRTPERRAYLQRALMAVLETGQSSRLGEPIEAVTVTPAGERHSIQQITFLVKTEHGNQIGLIIQDITARRAAEAALKESEEKYRALVETTETGYVILDAQGLVLDANSEYVRLSGHTALPEILGRPVAGWTAPYDLVRNALEIQHCFERGFTRNLVIDYVDRQGRTTPVEINATVLATAAGARIVTLCRDISERRKTEAEVHRLNRDLEVRVAERTAQLEAANQELEAFAYSVSHDLRAPLRIISSFGGILRQEHTAQLSDEARQHLDVIVRNAQKMDQLIHNLLVFSRLSRQALDKQLVQPLRLVQEVLDELRPEQAGRQLEISLGHLPDCQADPALLKQVFANLLSNALKYTRRRAVAQIEVGWRLIGGEGAYYVKDNGAGFDMAHADRLFGVFQRLHSEAEFEGTGVGLAIVQRIVRRHGGRAWAEAEEERGATFYFTLAGAD